MVSIEDSFAMLIEDWYPDTLKTFVDGTVLAAHGKIDLRKDLGVVVELDKRTDGIECNVIGVSTDPVHVAYSESSIHSFDLIENKVADVIIRNTTWYKADKLRGFSNAFDAIRDSAIYGLSGDAELYKVTADIRGMHAGYAKCPGGLECIFLERVDNKAILLSAFRVGNSIFSFKHKDSCLTTLIKFSEDIVNYSKQTGSDNELVSLIKGYMKRHNIIDKEAEMARLIVVAGADVPELKDLLAL